MTDPNLSPETLDRMLGDMDAQLQELRRAERRAEIRWITRGPSKLPKPQTEQVDETVAAEGKDPEDFWTRFKAAAREDICTEGGVIHAQWKKWGDLSNKTVLQQLTAILVAMGFSGNALQVLAVALGVIVVHLGVKTFCAEAAAVSPRE
jgi:hypothetical protein